MLIFYRDFLTFKYSETSLELNLSNVTYCISDCCTTASHLFRLFIFLYYCLDKSLTSFIKSALNKVNKATNYRKPDNLLA